MCIPYCTLSHASQCNIGYPEFPMKFEDFHAGDFKRQYQYKSFQPTLINQE